MAAKINLTSINRKKISWLLEQDLNVKLQAMQHHLEISRMLINDILEDEVIQYAGPLVSGKSIKRHSRKNNRNFVK